MFTVCKNKAWVNTSDHKMQVISVLTKPIVISTRRVVEIISLRQIIPLLLLLYEDLSFVRLMSTGEKKIQDEPGLYNHKFCCTSLLCY